MRRVGGMRPLPTACLRAGFRGMCAAILLMCFAALAYGQAIQGSILGLVTDPSGAAVPNATVTVTNEGKNFKRIVTSDGSGDYRVFGLEAGSYSVEVVAPGFKKSVQTNVDLTLGQDKRVDCKLDLGQVDATVTVQGQASQLDTESATLSNIKTTQDFIQLPLSIWGRGWANITNVTAGVQSASGFEVNGARDTGNNFTADGISVNDIVSSRNTPNGFSGDIEMIQEAKIMTANNSAEYAQVAQFATVSKSGSNEPHGSLYWGIFNSAFSARAWQDVSSPSFTNFNMYAITNGGPVYIPKLYNGRNKTFYFFSYGGAKYRIGNRQYVTIPTPAFRGGDFSSLLGKITILDPLNGTPFSGNKIPASRISPIAKTINDLVYPDPNTPGQGDYGLYANYTADPGGKWDSDVYSVRIDHQISNKNTIFTRVGLTINNKDTYPGVLKQGYTGYYDNFPGRSVVISDTHTFTPTVVNEAKAGFNRTFDFFYDTNYGVDIQSQLGIAGISNPKHDPAIGGLPAFDLWGAMGFTGTSNWANSSSQAQNEFQFLDHVSWVKGRHAWKFGAEIHRYQVNDQAKDISMRGEYSFDDQLSGLDYANFLLGLPTYATRSIPRPNAYIRSSLLGAFVQDEFKLNRRMTITYGVRYEYQTPWVEKFNRIFTFDPKLASLVTAGTSLPTDLVPAVASTLPIVSASQASLPTRSLMKNDPNNISPRIGLAFRPFADAQTVFRLGYGVYSQIWPGLLGLNATGGPWQSQQSWAIQNNQPTIVLPNPFAETSQFSGIQSVSGLSANFPNEQTQQWNASVGRQIRGIVVDVAYVGTRALKIPYADNLNLLQPSTTPFDAARRPYQRFDTVMLVQSGGSSSYNGLTIQADRKMAKGLFFNANYTWAKALTDVNLRSYAASAQQNQYQRWLERSDDPNIRRQQLVFSYTYELPIGHGRLLLPNLPKVANLAVGGWQLSGITTMRTGPLQSPGFSGVDPANTNQFSGRPDRVGDGNLDSGSMRDRIKNHEPIYDATAFVRPEAGRGYYGNSARYILTGPGTFNWNIVAAKNFMIRERARFQFRCEAFNAFNRANFPTPSSNISSGAFGLVTWANAGRSLLLGLRMDY